MNTHLRDCLNRLKQILYMLMGIVYRKLGDLYTTIQQYKNAIEFYEILLTIYKVLPNNTDIETNIIEVRCKLEDLYKFFYTEQKEVKKIKLEFEGPTVQNQDVNMDGGDDYVYTIGNLFSASKCLNT